MNDSKVERHHPGLQLHALVAVEVIFWLNGCLTNLNVFFFFLMPKKDTKNFTLERDMALTKGVKGLPGNF